MCGQAAHDAALQAKSRADAELARTAAERATALTRANKSDQDRIAAEKEWGEKLRAETQRRDREAKALSDALAAARTDLQRTTASLKGVGEALAAEKVVASTRGCMQHEGACRVDGDLRFRRSAASV